MGAEPTTAAQVMITAKDLGTVKVLPRQEVEKLKEMGKKYGLNPKAVPDGEAWVAMDEK